VLGLVIGTIIGFLFAVIAGSIPGDQVTIARAVNRILGKQVRELQDKVEKLEGERPRKAPFSPTVSLH
jgi:hypothetical protein